jgi:hypothetical protein
MRSGDNPHCHESGEGYFSWVHCHTKSKIRDVFAERRGTEIGRLFESGAEVKTGVT